MAILLMNPRKQDVDFFVENLKEAMHKAIDSHQEVAITTETHTCPTLEGLLVVGCAYGVEIGRCPKETK